jgi:formiminotetrahydrofolate cyclodeaminase
LDENIAAFMKVLDPQDNSTGGGTASAVAGAMAGALVAMVARLSIGKPEMEAESFYRDIASRAEVLSSRLFDGGRLDSQAFEAVTAAYALPKTTQEEKKTRVRAVQDAWTGAARVPLSNASSCAQVLELAAQLQGCSNPNAASDVTCAMLLARAGLLGCLANVDINLPALKDRELAAELAEKASELRERFA